jgi:hypothetical protein
LLSEVPLLSVQCRLRPAHPLAAWLVLLASVTSAACDDRDETTVGPRAGSGGIAAGGSAGVTGGTGGTGGSSGDGGTGGSSEGGTGGVLDAGADASGDASAAGNECVAGTLEAYCNRRACPAFADARDVLRDTGAPYIRTIIQRPCVAPNGAARIAVMAQYLQWSLTYIYAADTQQLVGVEYLDDVDGCMLLEPDDLGFGQYSGFYGEAAPDCSSGGLLFFIPDGCPDAGVIDNPAGGVDAGPPYECVLAP